jgi:hypothetical protein
MKYKFRAECSYDALTFIDKTTGLTYNFEIKQQDIDGSLIPDVDVIFESDLSLDEIRDKIREVIDGHVMLQTVKPIDEYTAERDYDLE